MAVTKELERLGKFARRLNEGSDELNALIERIDRALGSLGIGLDYVLPRPLDENTTFDPTGKRVIELSYVGYLRVNREFHLAVKMVKVMESRLAVATEAPGSLVPLLQAPRRLRYAAVDLLPELVRGLATQVEEMVQAMDRRRETAQSLVHNLESVAAQPASAAQAALAPQAAAVWPDAVPGAPALVAAMVTVPVPVMAPAQATAPAEAAADDRPRRTRLMGSGPERTP